MAKSFIGDMFGNKWVKISIYSLIILLIFWILFLLVKKLFQVAFVPTEEELSEEAINSLPVLPNEPISSITDAEALVIADDLEAAMVGDAFDWTYCMSMFNAINPYREDGNALRKIYQQFGIRDGSNLGAWFRGDLSQNCSNGFPWTYPCDIPTDCYDNNESELSCMQWYFEKSNLPI
tara:strand:+ start:209 stop:742 length:534 start_codon:yes stop_codon:yes gene_type:complete